VYLRDADPAVTREDRCGPRIKNRSFQDGITSSRVGEQKGTLGEDVKVV
jgi:hypothetical protein